MVLDFISSKPRYSGDQDLDSLRKSTKATSEPYRDVGRGLLSYTSLLFPESKDAKSLPIPRGIKPSASLISANGRVLSELEASVERFCPGGDG